VDGWASEVACWTYGKFMQTDSCDMVCTTNLSSNGCGHYTQLVWRNTTQVGCGVADCAPDGLLTNRSIWVCNYSAAGNYIGQNPY
jgi:pathogenesis-related protein 1